MFSAELTIRDKSNFSIALIWLFHLTAMIGVSIGFESWFVSKTPINLILAALLLIINYPLNNARKSWLALAFFSAGMLVEWVGIQYSFLFGTYSYGSNLGPKLDGVPFLIGINWSILVIITGTIANELTENNPLRVLIGATLMVFLDFFLEHSAPRFDFWTFAGGIAPLKNYIAWFAISALLHMLFQRFRMRGNFRFSLHLYAAQLLFFFYFFWLQ